MTDHIMLELIIGLAGGFIVIMIANWREHRDIHSKIDKVHHSMRDRLDKIWSHIKMPRD